jgi:hypothetical protein
MLRVYRGGIVFHRGGLAFHHGALGLHHGGSLPNTRCPLLICIMHDFLLVYFDGMT